MIVAAAALAIVFTACAPQTPDTTFVTSSDPELRDRVAALLPVLAARAGMSLVRPIRAERKTREQLESYLLFKLEEELKAEEAAHLTRTYSLVGLVDEDLDLRALFRAVYQEQVAGFYDPDSTALFVMDDMDETSLEGLLIHELVHAVQDQTANLDSLTAEERGNDRRAAAQSAIEGHATLIMFEYMLGPPGGQAVDISQLPDISQMLGPAMEAMREQYPALASAPAIVQEALLFPYLKGYSFVLALWLAEGNRPAPFGSFLPQSTEQILRPDRGFGPDIDQPTDLQIDDVPGYETLYRSTFGQGELEVLLQEHLGPEGRSLATGWDGDRYVLLKGPDGMEGLVWVSVWDSQAERDRFVQGFGATASQLKGPASLEALEVLGRPGAVLRVAIPEDVTVRVREKAGG